VYAEDIFLINLAMNLIILIIVKKILKSPKKMWRLILSGSIGGIYAIVFYYYNWNYFAGKIIISIIMTFIAFGWTNIWQFVKKYLSFHIITYALGGAVYGLVSLFGVYGVTFPLKTFIFAVCFVFVSVSIVANTLEKRKNLAKNIIPLTIRNNNNEVTIPCLQDTGNESGLIIAELGSLRKVLPSDFCINLAKDENVIDIFEKWKNALKLRIIPFNSLACGGYLLGFIPDEVGGEGAKPIAIYKGRLTQTEMYKAIA